MRPLLVCLVFATAACGTDPVDPPDGGSTSADGGDVTDRGSGDPADAGDGSDAGGNPVTGGTLAGPVQLTWQQRGDVCGKLSGCTGTERGMTDCLARMTELEHLGKAVAGRSILYENAYLNATCVLEAANCAAVGLCLRDGTAPGACATEGESCAGHDLASCAHQYASGPDELWSYPCSGFGLTCETNALPNGDQDPYCTLEACTANTCDGQLRKQCKYGVTELEDCAALGATCTDGLCIGNGGACAGATWTCTGTVRTFCAGHPIQAAKQGAGTEDCALRGRRCIVTTGAAALANCVVPAGETCNTTTGVMTVTTVGGEVLVDCKALGRPGGCVRDAANAVVGCKR